MAANPGEVTNLYSVSYNTNNSTGGVTPATQTAESSSATYTFKAPMGDDLQRTNYTFLGWSEDSSATTVAQYAPGATITLSTASPTKTLYAVWTRGLLDVTNMQDLSTTLCKASSQHDTKQLKDTRDNKTYWVTKLKDGNCWMTQNLDYNDPNSTKVSAPSGWTSTDASYRAYYDPGNYYYTTPTNWTQCSSGTGLSACTSKGWSTSGDAHYHAGNYYSYVAANSVCPAGWQLPTSNSTTDNGSFGKLTTAYSVTNSNTSVLRNNPLYFVPGGDVNSGKLYYAGSFGCYWSSTARGSDYAYNLYFLSDAVYPSFNLNRYLGMSVRCLVQGS